jgi:signal transduction histidine kinase
MRIMALEQLRHADRLRTVGQLAAGIAHELGTPLNVVAGRARMIARAEVDGAAARDSAGIVVEQADRMAHTIRQLLDFARARTPHMSREDVGALAAQAVDLMAPLAQKRGVSIAFSRGARAEAEVDAGQIQQVLTNLLLNAIHAMPNGGEVRVDVIRSQSDVRVDVIDDGVGMPPEVRSRLFEPFFTTKPVGEGTGLGLAVSWGIVAEHGGRIDVETEPGCGARFSVHIPVPT